MLDVASAPMPFLIGIKEGQRKVIAKLPCEPVCTPPRRHS